MKTVELAELTERDVLRALDVPGEPLIVLTHVDQVMVGPRLTYIERVHWRSFCPVGRTTVDPAMTAQ